MGSGVGKGGFVRWIVHPLSRSPLAGSLKGTVTVPGDKSISHRAVILRALAGVPAAEIVPGIAGLLESEDVASTRRVLETVLATPAGAPSGAAASGDCGNSGTTIRILTGALSGREGLRVVLDGDASLRRRPMERVAMPLRALGASITTTDGRPPVTIEGRKLRGATLDVNVASAQVKSALLLAGLRAEGRTEIRMPEASRDHTERMLRAFGVAVDVRDGGRVVAIEGGQKLVAQPVDVPGDISSAAFFLVAGLLAGQDVVLPNVGVNPLRTGILDVAARAGATIEKRNVHESGGEPRADLVVSRQTVGALVITAPDVPRLIDEIPVLALLAALADADESTVSGAEELRVKESDRIDAVCGEFAAIGLVAHPRADGLVIPGRQKVRGGIVQSRGDHRVAMTAAIAALVAERPIEIQDTACVETSFPGFLPMLKSLGAEVESGS